MKNFTEYKTCGIIEVTYYHEGLEMFTLVSGTKAKLQGKFSIRNKITNKRFYVTK